MDHGDAGEREQSDQDVVADAAIDIGVATTERHGIADLQSHQQGGQHRDVGKHGQREKDAFHWEVQAEFEILRQLEFRSAGRRLVLQGHYSAVEQSANTRLWFDRPVSRFRRWFNEKSRRRVTKDACGRDHHEFGLIRAVLLQLHHSFLFDHLINLLSQLFDGQFHGEVNVRLGYTTLLLVKQDFAAAFGAGEGDLLR